MTNRHVINGLRTARRDDDIPHEYLFVRFLEEIEGGFKERSYIPKQIYISEQEDLDIGFIGFNHTVGEELKTQPVKFTQNILNLFPGQPVGVVGFPYGTEGLSTPYSKSEIYRYGPVLQQGYVSAIAPYHGGLSITKILLDIRTAKGMSGSAVFLPQTGEVIGVHEGGVEWTLAYTIPVDQDALKVLLKSFDNTPQSDSSDFPL